MEAGAGGCLWNEANPFPQRHPSQPPSCLRVSAGFSLCWSGETCLFSSFQEELAEGLAWWSGLPLGSLLMFVLFGALMRPSVAHVCRPCCFPRGPGQGPSGSLPWPSRPLCLVSPHSHPSHPGLSVSCLLPPMQLTLLCLLGSPSPTVCALALLTTAEHGLQRVLSGSSATW